ncbi:MAG: SDR family NAD(P)-dependent oxidoreductase [Firmicutes bacterium]|nr:SDR family NAD(P)-dependent oxidoreductase [Bacillota bacterium]
MKKIVLVTGASRGIGAEVARQLSRLGFFVVLGYNKNKEKAEQVLKDCGGNGVCVQADISKYEDCEQMISEINKNHGEIYGLVCNAGVTQKKLLIDQTEKEMAEIINTNLMSAMYLTNLCLNQESEGFEKPLKHIVFVSSVDGIKGNAGEAVYSATKGGLIALSKSLKDELEPFGVAVECVELPAVLGTGMMDEYTKEELEEIKKTYKVISKETAAEYITKPFVK